LARQSAGLWLVACPSLPWPGYAPRAPRALPAQLTPASDNLTVTCGDLDVTAGSSADR